jgi:hypothetical protein
MSTTAAKRSRGVRVLGLAFLALFLLLYGVALIVYLGWHGKPAHWEKEQSRLAAVPDTQRQAISTSLRNRLLKQWSDPGERTPVTEADLFGHRRVIDIPYDELNTWIQTEGLDLLAEIDVEVPDSATTAMIDSPGGGLLRISFEVAVDQVQQVIALSFAVTISEDGTLTSTLKQATAGKLPLPVGTAVDIIASQADEGILLDLMQGKPVPPIELPIDASKDGLRDGRLIGLEVREDALVITRETVRRTKK